MRHLFLSAVALVLALCGNAFAQQKLIQHNDQSDPCRRFKIRILIPADVDREMPAKPFAGGIDSRMVSNPCVNEPQIAIAPAIRLLKKDNLLPPPAAAYKQDHVFVVVPPRFISPFVWRRP
jgi:hypothetical protein